LLKSNVHNIALIVHLEKCYFTYVQYVIYKPAVNILSLPNKNRARWKKCFQAVRPIVRCPLFVY